MFRKNLVPFIALAVLLTVGAYFYFTKTNSTLNNKDFNFKIIDTSSIVRIDIRNNKDTFYLSKNNGEWTVNENFRTNPYMIKLLFRVVSSSEIQSVLSSDIAEKAKILLEKEAPEISIKLNNGNDLQFYVLANKVTRKVWVMKKEEKKPFIIQLPGFSGNFAGIFYENSKNWRDNNLLPSIRNVKSIECLNLKNQDKSFKILINGNKAGLFSGNKKLKFNPEALNQYFYSFKNLPATAFINSEKSIDSLKSQKPIKILKVVNNNNNETDFKILKKGEPADLNEAYIIINDKDLAIAKYVNIDPLTPDIDFFK